MIVAKLEELSSQLPAGSRLEMALRYLEENRDKGLEDGRYEVDGNLVYALVQSYQTVPMDASSKFEAHRNYLDIQFIRSGIEGMGWAPLERMVVTKEYAPDKDVANGVCTPEDSTLIKVSEGEAAIFFPSDAHAPKLAAGSPGPVKKIVMKVALG